MSVVQNNKQTIFNQLFNQRPYDQIQRHANEKQLFQLIDHKNVQISVLHEVNTRLGAELALLQKKLGIDHHLILRDLESINEISVAYHYETAQLQYLDHLFRAYDENSLKQKKLIAKLYSELQDAEKKAQNIVHDNEYLLKEMQRKCQQILQIYHKGYPEDNLVIAYNKLQRQTEEEMINNVHEQNQYVMRKYNELQNKYIKLENKCVENEQNSSKYYKLFKQQSDELKQALLQVENISKINMILQRKFNQISQHNIELQTIKQQNENRIHKLQNDNKNIRNQYNLYKQTTNDENNKLQIDIDNIKLENQNLAKREKQYFQKNILFQKDIQNLKKVNYNLKKELEKTKSDFQQTIKMCQAYENKILHFNKKDENLKGLFQGHKNQLDQAILERDKALLKIEQLEKLIDNINTKQRQQLACMKNTYQKIIGSQNEKIKLMEQSQQDAEGVFSQRELSLKNQVQKLKREVQLLREQNNKFMQSMRANSGNEIVLKMREQEDKIENLTKMVVQKERSMNELKNYKDEIINNLESQNRDLTRVTDKQRNNNSLNLKELTQYKSKVSILQNEKQCLENEISRLKKQFENKVGTQDDNIHWRIKQLQQKLVQAKEKQKNTRLQAIKMLEKYDEAEEKLKLEYEHRIHQLEAQNDKLRKKAKK